MIIVCLAGGLGNQMFEYATARRLAHVRGVPLKLDLSGYGAEGDDRGHPGLAAFRRHVGIHKFNITAEQATPAEIAALKDPYSNRATLSRIVRRLRKIWPTLGWPATHFRERRYRFDPDVLNLPSPCYLSGYWQSEKYFADISDIICREFTPRDPTIVDYARNYISRLRTANIAVVSVHVRRGDLAHAKETLKSTKVIYGPPTTLEYVHQAIAKFEPGSCKFLVFSDSDRDIAWCKQNIKADNLHFSEGHNDLQDMMIMSACDHHVISSTYSWWAAWLNRRPGRRVISPRQWAYPGSDMVTDDLIPADWEMI
jgi:hypothetical protein